MIDYFIDWEYEGHFCIQIESIEIINPDIEQCNQIINAISCMLIDLNKHRDFLKDL